MKNILKLYDAPCQFIAWVGGKTLPETWQQCKRGDWLLWLFSATNPDDIRNLTLAKGHCANTVRKYMKYINSLNAVDAALAFGNGEITLKELQSFSNTAYNPAYAYVCEVEYSYIAAHCSANINSKAELVPINAAKAYFCASSDDDGDIAKAYHLAKTADICRKYLPLEIWKIPTN